MLILLKLRPTEMGIKAIDLTAAGREVPATPMHPVVGDSEILQMQAKFVFLAKRFSPVVQGRNIPLLVISKHLYCIKRGLSSKIQRVNRDVCVLPYSLLQ